jgi:hydrogenase maturation protein HypF
VSAADPVRVRIRVRGIVQGVGYRPFVWRLAQELALAGWVRNDAAGVEIEAAGAAATIAELLDRLRHQAPPLARVDTVDVRQMDAARGVDESDAKAAAAGRARAAASALFPSDEVEAFRILDSAPGAVSTAIGPDAALCADCRAELFDPASRRYRYAFTTCTHCGPRYTIARRLPYDREQTSLAPFPLCADCGREYADPADRRFHAEATCCPACGPRLTLRDAEGRALEGDPVAATLARLLAGDIVALQGLGGFHLACDARNPAAVARLRERKAREEKPFAVMAASPAVLAPLVEIGSAEHALLASPEAPIVLLRKRSPEAAGGAAGSGAAPVAFGTEPPSPAVGTAASGAAAAASGGQRCIAPGVCGESTKLAVTSECSAAVGDHVAPCVAWLGAFLPYTPLHWLLFHEAAGRPACSAWLDHPPELLLVMTSANPQGEPLVIDAAEALARLSGIADAFLVHDRAIVARADDSVVRATPRGFQFIRRGRGYTPRAIRLPRPGPSVLAFGGWYKNTICVTRGDEAFVSTHIGDLDNAASCDFLAETVERMLALTEVKPQLVAHDRHPDFHSSRAAAAFAAERGLPCVAVQHHHAHIAAVCAEHGAAGPVLGLALDGVGLGDDGGAWGGELLRVDGAESIRLGHLLPLALPGADRAAREPWRMAAAVLWQLGRGAEIEHRFAAQPGAATIRQMLERGLNCPRSSSLGRAFDAAAGLLGLQATTSFEGQAAMRLEGLAESFGDCAPLAGGWTIDPDGRLDLAPMWTRLADETDAARGAACFHSTLAAALADWAAGAAALQKIDTLAAGGGCWLNHRLSRQVRAALNASGVRFLEARQLPPNDGGLALGQAWAAMQLGRARE